MMKLNTDGLNNAPTETVAEVCFRVLDRVQGETPHIQAAAVAALFILLCEHYRTPAQDVMTAVKNLLIRDGADGTEPRFKALRMYLKHEMPR